MLRTTDNFDSGEWIAGSFSVTSERVTFQLKDSIPEGGLLASNWTDTGEFYITLWETSGADISGTLPDYYTPLKVNFQQRTTFVYFSDFIKIVE